MKPLFGCALIAAPLALVALVGAAAASAVALTGMAPATFVSPVDNAVISQGFGCTGLSIEPRAPQCPGGHWHSGVDLAARRGTPVHATQPGTVTVIADAGGFGLHVILDHGGGLTSLYGHLDTVTVADATVVEAGAQIGTVGTSGNSTGPHLHFEIRRNGVAEDPRGDLSLP